MLRLVLALLAAAAALAWGGASAREAFGGGCPPQFPHAGAAPDLCCKTPGGSDPAACALVVGRGAAAGGMTPLALGSTGNDFAVTWYSFQDNTPTNSASSASGRPLVPYVSVAVPFRALKKHGGPLSYGDKLYVDFLRGRRMPSGAAHTGWVQVDDFCGDSGDDAYCFQTVRGRKVPNIDVWVGDLRASGYDTSSARCDGPAGPGVAATKVFRGTPPAGAWVSSYGGRSRGSERCGDVAAARRAHGKCHFYVAPADTVKWCPKD